MKHEIPYLTLSEVVNEFMLASMNDRRKYYINYLNHAKWVWKKLMWNTIFVVKHKYIKVDTSTSPYSILIPKDNLRIINVSVEDECKNQRSLAYQQNMSVFENEACDVCELCGEKDVISECVNNISVVLKEHVIDGQPYTEKVWKRLCENGDIIEIRNVPVKTYAEVGEEEFEVTYETIETRVCNLETKKCGCVVNNTVNRELVQSCCGVLLQSSQRKLSNPTFAKANAMFGLMRIKDGRIYMKGPLPEYVLLSYQTNGQCNESEMMVPEYALDTLLLGIKARADMLAPYTIMTRHDKQDSKRLFDAAAMELESFLNPIYIKEFMDLQMILPKWGSLADQRDFFSDDCCETVCEEKIVTTKKVTKIEVIENASLQTYKWEWESPAVENCDVFQMFIYVNGNKVSFGTAENEGFYTVATAITWLNQNLSNVGEWSNPSGTIIKLIKDSFANIVVNFSIVAGTSNTEFSSEFSCEFN